jgi:hypothetical protein
MSVTPAAIHICVFAGGAIMRANTATPYPAFCDTNLSPGQCQLDHARRRKAVCGAIQAASGHRSNHSLPIRTFINDDRQQPRTRQFHIAGTQHRRALQLSRSIALLYNPLLPIHLHRDTWAWINIATVAVFCALTALIRAPTKPA